MINYDKSRLIKVGEYVSYVDGFLSEDVCDALIQYFEARQDQNWGFVAFYNSRAKSYPAGNDKDLEKFKLPEDLFVTLRTVTQDFVEVALNKKVVLQSTPHCQKWFEGGYASPHSDNSDFDGNYNGFQKNKSSCLIYLNDNYSGGELYFPQHGIELKPKKGTMVIFEGGHYNIHGVKEVLDGVRYTNGFFWDFADSVYTAEDEKMWEDYMSGLKSEQSEIRKDWGLE
jgi:hypothetical protein